jgi:hypothetical protein
MVNVNGISAIQLYHWMQTNSDSHEKLLVASADSRFF